MRLKPRLFRGIFIFTAYCALLSERLAVFRARVVE
jgi:hypothetical protein